MKKLEIIEKSNLFKYKSSKLLHPENLKKNNSSSRKEIVDKFEDNIKQLETKTNFFFGNLSEQKQENFVIELNKKENKIYKEFCEIEMTNDNIETIKYILNKTLKNKSELNIVKLFLYQLNFMKKIVPENNASKFFNDLSSNLKSEKKSKGTLLFRLGEKGDKFYLILSGEISIFKLKETRIELSFLKYFEHLILLKLYQEEGVLKRIISANNKNYILEEKEFNDYYNSLCKFIDNYFPLNLNFDDKESLINTIKKANLRNVKLPFNYLNEVREIIFFYIIHKLEIMTKTKQDSNIYKTESDYIDYTYIDINFKSPFINDKTKLEVIIYQYFFVSKKKCGEGFGELSLLHKDNKRTATVFCSTDCVLGYLKKEDYNKIIKDIDIKARKEEFNFIRSFSIFDKLNWLTFETKYFNYFNKMSIYRGNEIVRQGETSDFIYFLNKGEFEISAYISQKQIYQIISEILGKVNFLVVDKLPNIKKYIKIYKTNNEIIGLKNLCYNDGKSLITCKCLSEFGEIFSLEKSVFKEIVAKSKDIRDNLKNLVFERNKILVDRFMCILKKNTMNIIKTKKNNDKTFKKFVFGTTKVDLLKKTESIHSLDNIQKEKLIKSIYTSPKITHEKYKSNIFNLKNCFSPVNECNNNNKSIYLNYLHSLLLTKSQNINKYINTYATNSSENSVNDLLRGIRTFDFKKSSFENRTKTKKNSKTSANSIKDKNDFSSQKLRKKNIKILSDDLNKKNITKKLKCNFFPFKEDIDYAKDLGFSCSNMNIDGIFMNNYLIKKMYPKYELNKYNLSLEKKLLKNAMSENNSNSNIKIGNYSSNLKNGKKVKVIRTSLLRRTSFNEFDFGLIKTDYQKLSQKRIQKLNL